MIGCFSRPELSRSGEPSRTSVRSTDNTRSAGECRSARGTYFHASRVFGSRMRTQHGLRPNPIAKAQRRKAQRKNGLCDCVSLRLRVFPSSRFRRQSLNDDLPKVRRERECPPYAMTYERKKNQKEK